MPKLKDDTLYIFTAEVTKPSVDDIDSNSFEKLRSLLLDSLGVLWLTCGSIIDAKNALYAHTQGLSRTVKQEDGNKRYIQLDFESAPDGWTLANIPHIVYVLQQSFDYHLDSNSIEWEYAVKGSSMNVTWFYPDAAQDRAYSGT